MAITPSSSTPAAEELVKQMFAADSKPIRANEQATVLAKLIVMIWKLPLARFSAFCETYPIAGLPTANCAPAWTVDATSEGVSAAWAVSWVRSHKTNAVDRETPRRVRRRRNSRRPRSSLPLSDPSDHPSCFAASSRDFPSTQHRNRGNRNNSGSRFSSSSKAERSWSAAICCSAG